MNKDLFETQMHCFLYRLFIKINDRKVELHMSDLLAKWIEIVNEFKCLDFDPNQISTLWQNLSPQIPNNVQEDFSQNFEKYQSELARYGTLFKKHKNPDKFIAAMRTLVHKVWLDLCQHIARHKASKFEVIVRYE